MLTQEPVPRFNGPVSKESTGTNLSLSAKQMGNGSTPSTQMAAQAQKAKKKPTRLFPREGDNPGVFWETGLVPQGFLGLLQKVDLTTMTEAFPTSSSTQAFLADEVPEGLGSRSVKLPPNCPFSNPQTISPEGSLISTFTS